MTAKIAKYAKLEYKGQVLEQTFRPDFICYRKIIVELKAVKEIAPEHKGQVLTYLRATGLTMGLIVNFGAFPKTRIVRVASAPYRDFNSFQA